MARKRHIDEYKSDYGYGGGDSDPLDMMVKIYKKNITVNNVKLLLSDGEEEEVTDIASDQELFAVIDEYGGHDRDFYEYEDAEDYKNYLINTYSREFAE